MSTALQSYLTALVFFSRLWTCKAMSSILEGCSHDRLTRLLAGNWCGKTLLYRVVFQLFDLHEGILLIDDTMIEKPHSKAFDDAFWSWCNTKKTTVFGITIVFIAWKSKDFLIPLSFRIWRKGGPSKLELTLEMLSEVRNQLRLKPDFVAFDSWYSAAKILKRIDDYGWKYVCRLRANRTFNEVQLKKLTWTPYESRVGTLNCGLKVRLVRYKKKFFATNRVLSTPKEIRDNYRQRQFIEELFKRLKSGLGIHGCQSGHSRSKNAVKISTDSPDSTSSQAHHIALCCLAYVVIEKERQKKVMSWYKLRETLVHTKAFIPMPVLHEIFELA